MTMTPALAVNAIPLEIDGLSGWTPDEGRLSIAAAFAFESPVQARRFATYGFALAGENQVVPTVAVAGDVVRVTLAATSTDYLNRKLLQFAALLTSTHAQHLAARRRLQST